MSPRTAREKKEEGGVEEELGEDREEAREKTDL